jgi:hypothetical protein
MGMHRSTGGGPEGRISPWRRKTVDKSLVESDLGWYSRNTLLPHATRSREDEFRGALAICKFLVQSSQVQTRVTKFAHSRAVLDSNPPQYKDIRQQGLGCASNRICNFTWHQRKQLSARRTFAIVRLD